MLVFERANLSRGAHPRAGRGTGKGLPVQGVRGDERKLNRPDIRSYVRSIEDWWFDRTRSVQTSGNVKAFAGSKVVGEIKDSFTHIPVRVANARTALRELPINNHSEYTFIDMGSGKGRMLFVAAEHPFRKVRGVEFVIDLHEQARDNIRRNNHWRQKCVDIESINADAAEFEFPHENMVIYLFNPFGPEVLGRMLINLERAIDKHPRHVVILLLYPKFSHVVAGMRGMHLYKQTRRHHIYQNS
jgi:hypothetical protein